MPVTENKAHKSIKATHVFISKSQYKEFELKALSQDIEIVSADIFDTLLLRTPKPEFHRFLDISRRQLEFLHTQKFALNTLPKDMLILRILAAKAAYRNVKLVSGVREARYYDFMKIILKSLACPVELCDRMKKIELEYEKSVLRPNHTLVDIFKKALQAGKHIIWISDMYFPHKDIEDLVEFHVPSLSFSNVYASCDEGISKASGLFYDFVAEKEGVKTGQIVHCGDSYHSDYVMAKKHGIQAVFVPRTKPWRGVRGYWQKLFNKRYSIV